MNLKNRFLSDTRGLLSQLVNEHDGLGRISSAVLLRHTHSLKSLALQVGADELAVMLHGLEAEIQKGGPELNLTTHLEVINTELERIDSTDNDSLIDGPDHTQGRDYSIPKYESGMEKTSSAPSLCLSQQKKLSLLSKADNLDGMFRLLSRGYGCYMGLFASDRDHSSPRHEQLRIRLETIYPVADTIILHSGAFVLVLFSSQWDPWDVLIDVIIPGINLIELARVSYQDLLRSGLHEDLQIHEPDGIEDQVNFSQRIHGFIRKTLENSNKKIDFTFIGNFVFDSHIHDTVESIILQILRNAVVHGIELPDKRVLLGKVVPGTVKLLIQTAPEYYEIVIEDDGTGMQDESNRIDDATAATKEDRLSGHGIGKASVKWQVENLLQGSYSQASVPRRGTKIRFRIPRQLTSKRVLIVSLDGNIGVLPFDAILAVPERLGVTHPRRSGKSWFGLWEHRLCQLQSASWVPVGENEGKHLRISIIEELNPDFLSSPCLIVDWNPSPRILLVESILGIEVVALGPRYEKDEKVFCQHVDDWIPVICTSEVENS